MAKAVEGRYLVVSEFVARVTRRMPPVEQKLLTLPGQLRSSPVFCGIPVTQYLVFCVVFVDQHLSFCPISFGHYIVWYSSIDLRLLVTSLVSSDVSH
jgi:hypothetical protein